MPLIRAPFHPTFAEFCRAAGLLEAPHLHEEARELYELGVRRLDPRAGYLRAAVNSIDELHIEIGGVELEGECLVSNLSGRGAVYPYVAGCGRGLEEAGGDDLSRFWIDDSLKAEVCAEFAVDRCASLNPGSGSGGLWSIEQQGPLFRLLGSLAEEVGVALTESVLMIPNKSLSGILFPTSADWTSCTHCDRASCRMRRLIPN